MLFRVVDIETTGIAPPDAAVCEIGWWDVTAGDREFAVSGITFGNEMLCNPGHPIPPQAMGVHHITDEMVSGSPPLAGVVDMLTMGGPFAYVAHRADFEWAFLNPYLHGARWIDTLKVARRIWPYAPNHQNQTLRYWLSLPIKDAWATPPHRAAPDAYVTAHIFARMIEEVSVEQMLSWTSEPSLLSEVTFGKHRGLRWSELPRDYLDWIANKSDMGPDEKFTANYHLREGAR